MIRPWRVERLEDSNERLERAGRHWLFWGSYATKERAEAVVARERDISYFDPKGWRIRAREGWQQ